MKLSVLLIVIISYCLCAFGQQDSYNPRILMLTPREISYDKRFKKDIQEISKHIKDANFMGEDLSEHPENIQATIKSYQDYSQKAGPEGLVPLLISERMLFTMFRGERDFIVLIDTLAPFGTANELKDIADRYGMQHIIYFPEVRLYYEGDTGIAMMRMNIYDRASNTVSLEYINTEDWNLEEYDSPELSDEQTAYGLLYNVTLSARIYIFETISTTNAAIQERIKQARAEQASEPTFNFREDDPNESVAYKKLVDDYFTMAFDRNRVQTLFRSEQIPFPWENIYQVLNNTDSTKFVAFAVESYHAQNSSFEKSYVEKACEQYGIVDIRRADNTYKGYIIKGIKENGHWYFDRVEVEHQLSGTLEEAQKILFCHLYDWNFFEAPSIVPSADFWSDQKEEESWLFSRIKWPCASMELYPYEGMRAWDPFRSDLKSFSYLTYIEANHIVRAMESFEPVFFRETLEPFYKQQHQSGLPSAPLLIYTPDRQIVLHPMVSSHDSGNQRLAYLIFDRSDGTVYEWTYFPEKTLAPGTAILQAVKADLNQLTVLSMDKYLIVGDERFRDNYLLKKDENGYVYLNQVKARK